MECTGGPVPPGGGQDTLKCLKRWCFFYLWQKLTGQDMQRVVVVLLLVEKKSDFTQLDNAEGTLPQTLFNCV